MNHFIISILLSFLFFGFSIAKADLSDEPSSQSDYSELSVWKIKNVDGLGNGTGFFIETNHFVTNFHIVSHVLKDGDFEGIVLSQEGSDFVLKIKRVLVLSALYDLALLETEESATSFLSLREHSPKLGENLSVIAYPGILAKVRKIGDVIHEDERIYTFPVDNSDLWGVSGGPVLDEWGQVVGVAFGG